MVTALGTSVHNSPHYMCHTHTLTYCRWFAAYSAATSFRYSHYFVSLLSECSTLAAGIGYQPQSDGSLTWYSLCTNCSAIIQPQSTILSWYA